MSKGENEVKKEKRERINVDVDPALKKKFREALLMNERTAVDVLNEFVKDYIVKTLGKDVLDGI